MTTAQTAAQQRTLDIARGYFNAWTARDIDTAMTFVADDIVFDAPFGRAHGVAGLREALETFMEIYSSAELIDIFADEHSAAIIYMAQTAPASDVPALEYLGIEDGLINYKRLLFDTHPFQAAQSAQ
jgi:ketosteroid isomerase-like protein